MSLPEINITPVYKLFLEVMNKNIEYSPYNIEQEKSILTALSSEISSDIIANYLKVVDNCVNITSEELKNISIVDFLNLTMQIRAKSAGEILQLKRKECKKCEKSFEFEMDIEEAIKYTNKDCKSKIVKINENLQLQIVPLKLPFLNKMEELKNEIDIYTYTIANSISKVIYNEKIYTEFTVDEIINNILNKLMKKNLLNPIIRNACY